MEKAFYLRRLTGKMKKKRKMQSKLSVLEDNPTSSINDGKQVTVVMMGAKNVGKTALVSRFTQGLFPFSYKPTVEDCYFKNHYHVESGSYANIRIIDTSGYYHFPAMQRLNIIQADVLILAYEVRNIESMKRVIELYNTARELRAERHHIPIIIIGTKIDLKKDTDQYKNRLLEEFLTQNPNAYCRHILTSARLDLNVTEVFDIAINLLEKLRKWLNAFNDK